MQQETGIENGKEIFESHLDLSGNSLLHTGCIYFLDGSSMTTASQVGNVGNQGTQGFQGSTGVQGPGLQGSTGSRGNQGPQGNQGSQGMKGGTGNQGAQGYDGNTGNKGGTGNRGNTGMQGATGAASVTGNPHIFQCNYVNGSFSSVSLSNAIIEFGMETSGDSGRKIVVLQKINNILNVVVLVQTDNDGETNEQISMSVLNMTENYFEVLISDEQGYDISRNFYYQAIGT
jgi:hypothetical protein